MNATRPLRSLGRHQLKLLLGLFLAALALRLVFVVRAVPDRTSVLAGDGWDYYALAINLSEGRGFSLPSPALSKVSAVDFTSPTARRPPLFPFLAAAVMKVASFFTGRAISDCYGAVLLANALLDAGTVLLVFRLAQLAAGLWVGFFAAAGYAVNYYVFQHTWHFISEPLFIFLQTAALLWLLKATRENRPRHLSVCVSGFLWGLATLTRPLVLFFPVLASCYLLVRPSPGRRKSTAGAGRFLVAFFLTLLPWTLRNRATLGDWVLISTVGGQTFFHSNHAQSHGQWQPLPSYWLRTYMSEAKLDAYYYREGLEFILDNPGLTLKNDILKVLRLYYVFYPGYDIFFGTVFLLAIPGFWLTRKTKTSPLFLMLILYTTALCAVFWGTPRFRDPLFPCFLVYAGLFLSDAFRPEAEKDRPRGPRIYTTAVLAINLAVWLFADPVRAAIKSLIG